MKYQDFKAYFGAAFQGMYDFMTNIIDPIATLVEKGNEHNQNYAVTDYVQICKDANINAIFDFGKYNVGGAPVSVFEVVLDDNCIIARARKNIQTVIRRMIGTFSGSFIVFHYADNSSRNDKDTWRFSWVMKEDSQKHSTQAKRYTYLCGPSYSCRTIAERFNVLFTEKNKTLDAITKAFDVEALSDEFFYNYRALYSKILGDGEKGKSKYTRYKKMADIPEQELGFCDFLERHKDDARYFGPEFSRWDEKTRRDYIKKLMGRLVFLQFLQKKGWMCGNPNYIKSLFEIYVTNKGENVTDTIPGSFLDEVLEPLFFGVLNTKVDDRKALFEKKGWNLKLLDEWKNIPYLNGGLFEQEEFDKPKSAFSNSIFNELFTLFSEYNFTIDENDPNDAEIGIDPEMLGKIFESQLEDNKDKGAFYTPKEIVQYMCKESLIAYLCTKIPDFDDDIRAFVEDYERIEVPERENVLVELKNVKICDPAIGSGAFPMGMLNLLVALREKLGDKTSRYEQKREIIQNNIFGVDIEKGAVDIARLRFWLSIVIDEETSNPHALPNLDYQIVKGNSLLHRFGLDTSFKDVFSDYNKQHGTKYTVADYKAWVADYLNTTDHNKKEEFRKKIEEIKSCFRSELTKKEVSKEEKLKKKINDIETANLFGLDQEQKKQILELKKQLTDLEKKHQDIVNNGVYENAFEWRFEFPALLDKKGNFIGFDIVIANPPYVLVQTLNNPIAENIYKKEYRVASYKIDLFHLFIEAGMNLLKEHGVLTYINPTTFLTNNYTQPLRDFLLNNSILSIVNIGNSVFNANVNTGIEIVKKENPHNSILSYYVAEYDKKLSINLISAIKQSDYLSTESHIIQPVISDIAYELSKKIENGAKQLKFYATVNFGMQLRNRKIYESDVLVSPNPQQLTTFHRKCLTGKDISFYTSKWQNRYCYFNEEARCGGCWIESVHNAKNKILVRQVGTVPVCGIDLEGLAVLNSAFMIVVRDLNPFGVLGLLNSRLMRFYWEQKFEDKRKTFPKIKGSYLELLPIIPPSNDISSLVQKIVTLKQESHAVDSLKIENKIDLLVYHLYGLTYDEVLIVDPETPITREEY